MLNTIRQSDIATFKPIPDTRQSYVNTIEKREVDPYYISKVIFLEEIGFCVTVPKNGHT